MGERLDFVLFTTTSITTIATAFMAFFTIGRWLVRFRLPVRPPYSPPQGAYTSLRPVRVFEILIAALLLVWQLPLILLTSLLIRLESRGPALQSQKRVGYRGIPFGLLSFRTTTIAVPARIQAEGDVVSAPLRVEHDPRITRVGRFLRRTYLDQIPALFNILMGDLAFVGPRAPLVSEVIAGKAEIPARTPGLAPTWLAHWHALFGHLVIPSPTFEKIEWSEYDDYLESLRRAA